jgi:hypothetical protein
MIQQPVTKWPWWKMALAYLALAALAAASIALVDRKVHDPPDIAPGAIVHFANSQAH